MEEYSTRSRFRRRRRNHAPPYRAIEDDGYEMPRRRRGRGMIPLAILGLGIWFAPWIAAKTPLADWAVQNALADVRGRARIQSVSLGWLSPIVAEGVELRDRQDETLIKIPRVTINKRLYAWLTNRSDLGAIRLEDPQFQVAFDKDTTNLEQAFAAWLKSDPNEPAKPLLEAIRAAGVHSFDVEIVDGTATLVDTLTKRTCRLDSLAASARMTSPDDGLRARMKGVAQQDSSVSGFEGGLEILPSEGEPGAGVNRASLKSEAFPLWVAAAAMRRVDPGLQLDGHLVSDVHAEWRTGKQGVTTATLKADVAAKDLFAASDWIQGDQLRLAEARMPVELTWKDQQLQVSQARFDSELGQLAFNGTVDLSQGWAHALRAKPYQLTGRVDLTRVAAMLPRTVRVRENTQITSGEVDINIQARQQRAGLGWQGRIETTRLEAQSGDQRLSWNKPVLISFDARETAEGIVVDRIYGEADFLELQGEARAADGHLTASFDLDRLARELSRFVDLGTLELGGSGSAYLAWQRKEGGRLEATGELEARDFRLSRPGARPWVDPELSVSADLVAYTDGVKLERIDKAEAVVTAGGDVLKARLQQPVVEFEKGGIVPISLALRGELARWAPRAEPFVGSYPEYQLSGDCDLNADIVYSSSFAQVEPIQMRATNFQLLGPTVNISEPTVDMTASAKWDSAESRLEVANAHWSSPALVADAQNVLVIADPQRPWEMRGALRYSGDAAKLWRWLGDASAPSAWQLAGRVQGQADVRQTGDMTLATIDSRIDQFTAVWGEHRWQEPQLRLVSHVEHDGGRQAIKLTDFNLVSQALSCSAAGDIRDLSGERELRLNGRVRYDLSKLQPVWQQFTGDGLRLTGSDEREFSLRGPLGALASAAATPNAQGLVPVRRQPATPEGNWLARLEGRAELGWRQGDLYGFALGAGDLRAALSRGFVSFDPIEVVASQGRLRVAPSIRLSPDPMELTVAPGRVAEQVMITPEMCDRALKFIAPVLAGVTEAQGKFSVDVEGCHLPLADPKSGDLGGKMTVHSVEVGPGPLVQELAVLLNRASPARLSRESVVEFRMVKGRVYHRGLQLVFPDFTLRTYGSVGLDETVAIMAELPVPPKWIGKNPLGDALKNQTIQLPIGGTLRAPKIDQQAMQQTSAQFLRNTATNAIQQQLFKEVDRLLGQPR